MRAKPIARTLKSTYLIGIIIFSAVWLGVSQRSRARHKVRKALKKRAIF